MDLQKGYQFINFIANKELAGKTMQPYEYNVNLEAASMDFFNREFQKARAHAIENKQNVFSMIELGHPLHQFIKSMSLAELPASGKMALPALYVDVRSARCKVSGFPKKINFVSDERLNNLLSNPLETSLLDQPAAAIRSSYIEVWPKSATDIVMHYLRMPEKPYYGYTVDAATDLPVYNSVIEARGTAKGTFSGTAADTGDVIAIKVTIGTTDVTLGEYECEGDESATTMLHIMAGEINYRTVSHGFTADVINSKLVIYAPIGVGEDANAYVAAAVISGTGDIAIAFTGENFADTETGVTGSRQLEWGPEYHMEIYKMIMSNIGVNLSDERLVAYQKEFGVSGV